MATREDMVEMQLKRRDIDDPAVLKAMSEVDRSLFVPADLVHHTYDDSALPIGRGQTISQPYIVAFMAQVLQPDPSSKVLEVGTGCGYNAAVLSRICSQVFSIEIIEWLVNLARENLAKTNYTNIEVRHGDGYEGWAEEAPFDGIVLTAAPPRIPESLKEQLKIGGRLIAPVGITSQKLIGIERIGSENFSENTLLMVNFVPMTGIAQL